MPRGRWIAGLVRAGGAVPLITKAAKQDKVTKNSGAPLARRPNWPDRGAGKPLEE